MQFSPINGFSIDYRTVRKLQKFDSTIHFHEYFEIEFIFDGSAIHYLNGNSIPVKRGYFNLVTPRDFHTYHLSESERIKLFNIAFTRNNISEDILSILLKNPITLQGTLDEDTTMDLEHLFTLLFKEFQRPSDNFNFIQRSLLESIITIALDHIPQDDESNIKNSKTINNLLFHIEKEFLNPSLSLVNIADTLKITQNYLGKLIRDYTGLSFNQYVNQKRLKYAANLLKNDSITIQEASENSGFSSTSYFIKLFKSEYGMTPNEYKNLL